MRRIQPFSWALCSCLAAATSASAEPPKALPFPVVVGAAEAHSGIVGEKTVLLEQSVRPLRAIRIKQPITISYKPKVLDRKLTKDGIRSVTLDAGAMLILALDSNGEAWCAASADRKDGWMTFYDVGVCFRDSDKDGVLESQLLIEPTSRIRTPFEIVLSKDDAWAPANLPYEQAPESEIPSAKVVLEYQHFPAVRLTKAHATLRFNLCSPVEISLKGRDPAQPPCGVLQGRAQGGDSSTIYGWVEVSFKKSPVQTVSWGPLSATLTQGPDNSVTAAPASAINPGSALLYLASAWRSTGDYREQTSVFGIHSLRAP